VHKGDKESARAGGDTSVQTGGLDSYKEGLATGKTTLSLRQREHVT